MPDFQLADRIGGAFFITKEDDLRIRMKQSPAPDRIALGDADVPAEGLGGRENRQHIGLRQCSGTAGAFSQLQ